MKAIQTGIRFVLIANKVLFFRYSVAIQDCFRTNMRMHFATVTDDNKFTLSSQMIVGDSWWLSSYAWCACLQFNFPVEIVICCTLFSAFHICCISPESPFFCASKRMKNHEMQYIDSACEIQGYSLHSIVHAENRMLTQMMCVFIICLDIFKSINSLREKNPHKYRSCSKCHPNRTEQAMGISNNHKFVAFYVCMYHHICSQS